MDKIITKEKEFNDLVHTISGQQVMLDSILAQLYGYTVKRLNEQVRRNKGKFPDDFMFQLSEAAEDISLMFLANKEYTC